MGEITDLLERWRKGDRTAEGALFERIYPQLHALAVNRLRRVGDVRQLNATELAHDVYLKLADQGRVEWQNRQQFFAIAARITRRTIIDFIRHEKRQKRGGGLHQVTLSDMPGKDLAITDILSLNECLDQLAEIDELAAQVVEMRYFGELSLDEVAEGLPVSRRTVARRWRFARAWLKECLEAGCRSPGSE